MTTTTKPKQKDAMQSAAEAPDLRGVQISRDNCALPNVTQHDQAIPFFLLPIDKVQPWSGNPRKNFSPVKLQELTESIRAKGILEPLLVRPRTTIRTVNGIPKTDTIQQGYEVAAGERRRRAAKLAGLAELPCIVRELSDRDMLEIAVVENEQREDVGALEKAEGYRRLHVEHNVPVEEIARRVGKTVSTVYGLLKLCDLPASARKAVEAGELPQTTAQLIARVPSQFHRERVSLAVVQGIDWHVAETFNDPKVPIKVRYGDGTDGEALSCRETKDLIQRMCMLELKGSPFPTKLDGLAGQPSCEACPKRVGNLQKAEPEEYAGIRADVCTDPGCYREKADAWAAKLLAEGSAKGHRVLTGKETKGLWDYSGRKLEHDAGYFDLAEQCWEDKKKRSYKQLLEKHVAAADIVLACNEKGTLHRLVARTVGLPILRKEHGLLKRAVSSSTSSADARWKREQAARQADDKLKKEAARRCMGLAAAMGEQIARSSMLSVGCCMDGSQGGNLLRRLVVALAARCWYETNRQIVVRRGLDKAKTAHAGMNCSPIVELALTMNPQQLVGLMTELLAGGSAAGDSYYESKDSKAFWEFLGIDRKKVLSEVRKERKAGANGKPHRNGAARIRTAHDLRRHVAQFEANGHDEPDSEQPDPKRGKSARAKKRKAHPEIDVPEPDDEDEPAGECQICGCTEANCRDCVERTGEPCEWTSPAKDLCTACLPLLEEEFSVLAGKKDAAWASLSGRLKDAGIRTVGSVLELGGLVPLPKGITGEQAVEFREKAMAWIKDQLKLDIPTNSRCWSCGEDAGDVVEESALAEDEDLVPLSKLPDNLAKLYPNLPAGEQAYLCGNCIARLIRNRMMARPVKAKAGK